jgi:predicted RNase H-like HicB family nuclease
MSKDKEIPNGANGQGETQYVKGTRIDAVWDDEARVYVVTSEEFPGLATEAETVEALIEKLRVMIPELVEENFLSWNDESEIPVQVMSQRVESFRIRS